MKIVQENDRSNQLLNAARGRDASGINEDEIRKPKLTVGTKVYFLGEKLPYEVMATSERYAVVSRKLNRTEDADLLHHQVEMSAYSSFTEAYKANKDNPVYSLIDFKENARAPHNLIFGHFDYFDKDDCREAIDWLEEGKMKLSHRGIVKLNIDWNRTNKVPEKI